MSIDRMLEWLRKTEIPLTTISKKTNISRKTLYNWINGGEVRKRSYLKVYDIYKHDIELINTNIQLKEGHTVEAQYIIDLQKEKIERLEEQISETKLKPAYHFKIVGKYIQKTDTWHDAQIFGDVSMLGFSNNELNDILSVKGNNPNSWIDRYHPDSYEKLHESVYWKKTKSDFHHCTWNHMMWKSKSGQYVCLNIDMYYNKKKETVTTLFYYVNGDND